MNKFILSTTFILCSWTASATPLVLGPSAAPNAVATNLFKMIQSTTPRPPFLPPGVSAEVSTVSLASPKALVKCAVNDSKSYRCQLDFPAVRAADGSQTWSTESSGETLTVAKILTQLLSKEAQKENGAVISDEEGGYILGTGQEEQLRCRFEAPTYTCTVSVSHHYASGVVTAVSSIGGEGSGLVLVNSEEQTELAFNTSYGLAIVVSKLMGKKIQVKGAFETRSGVERQNYVVLDAYEIALLE